MFENLMPKYAGQGKTPSLSDFFSSYGASQASASPQAVPSASGQLMNALIPYLQKYMTQPTAQPTGWTMNGQPYDPNALAASAGLQPWPGGATLVPVNTGTQPVVNSVANAVAGAKRTLRPDVAAAQEAFNAGTMPAADMAWWKSQMAPGETLEQAHYRMYGDTYGGTQYDFNNPVPSAFDYYYSAG